MNNKITCIIGDPHGCYDEFITLLNKINTSYPNARIICVGDLSDRGPDSIGVIRKIRELKIECVMGNHDLRIFNWLKSNKPPPPGKEYYSSLNEDDLSFINNLPTSIKLEDAIVVHAGLRENVSLENQTIDDLTHMRFIDSKKRMISLRKIAKFGKENLDAHFWTEFGSFGTNVIYGHHVHSYEDIKINSYADGTACYGIDTGCCFGGRLTALVWETKEVIQVQANKMYFKPGF